MSEHLVPVAVSVQRSFHLCLPLQFQTFCGSGQSSSSGYRFASSAEEIAVQKQKQKTNVLIDNIFAAHQNAVMNVGPTSHLKVCGQSNLTPPQTISLSNLQSLHALHS